MAWTRGDLVQRCSSDVETIRVFFSNDVLEIARAVALLLALLPLMFWRNPSLAALSLLLMPLIFTFAVLFFRRVKQVFTVTDEAEAAMTAALQENLTGIRVVRAFSRQPEERLRFAGFNATFRDHNRRLIDLMGLYWSASDLLCLTQVGIVLFAGAYQLQAGTLSVGELFAFFTWEFMVIFPLRQFGRILTDAGKASVALTRLQAILDAAPEPQGVPEAVPQGPSPWRSTASPSPTPAQQPPRFGTSPFPWPPRKRSPSWAHRGPGRAPCFDSCFATTKPLTAPSPWAPGPRP